MEATPRSRIGPRAAFAALLWIAAVAIVALVVAGELAPAATQSVAESVGVVGARMLLGAAVAGGIALLLWPPAVPWIRLRWKRMRDRMGIDQGPMLEALGRLKHFETAPDHLTVGRTLLRMGQAPRAIPHLIRAVEIEPDSAQAAHLAGVALFEVGAVEPARNALRHAVSIDPGHAFGDALLMLGRALERLGEDQEAEKVLADHEERNGPSPRVDLLRARALMRLGQRDRARELCERATQPAKDKGLESPEDRLARAQAKVFRRRIGGAA